MSQFLAVLLVASVAAATYGAWAALARLARRRRGKSARRQAATWTVRRKEIPVYRHFETTDSKGRPAALFSDLAGRRTVLIPMRRPDGSVIPERVLAQTAFRCLSRRGVR